MDWLKEFEEKLDSGEIATDDEILDFITENIAKYVDYRGLKFFVSSVWKAYYQWKAKGTACAGCYNVSRWGLFPCTECSRKVEVKDYYEKENS